MLLFSIESQMDLCGLWNSTNWPSLINGWCTAKLLHTKAASHQCLTSYQLCTTSTRLLKVSKKKLCQNNAERKDIVLHIALLTSMLSAGTNMKENFVLCFTTQIAIMHQSKGHEWLIDKMPKENQMLSHSLFQVYCCKLMCLTAASSILNHNFSISLCCKSLAGMLV